GLTLAVPTQGTRFENGEGTIRLADDLVTIERLALHTPGRGDIPVAGTVRLDPALSLPVAIRVVAQKALLANRPDTSLTLSSDLRLEGSVRDGLALTGTVTVDRAELSIAGGSKA